MLIIQCNICGSRDVVRHNEHDFYCNFCFNAFDKADIDYSERDFEKELKEAVEFGKQFK